METGTIFLGVIAVSSAVTAVAAVIVANVVNGINNRTKIWLKDGPAIILDTVNPPVQPPTFPPHK